MASDQIDCRTWRSPDDRRRAARRWRWMLTGALAVAALALAAFLISRPAPTPPPQCGVVRSGPGPERSDTGPLDCFYQAFQQGRLTNVRTIRKTVEGDPITYDLKIVLPGKRIQVNIDSRDHFGARGRFQYLCEGVQSVPDTAYSGQTHLVLTRCYDERGFLGAGQILP
jgi:hypothetical protein